MPPNIVPFDPDDDLIIVTAEVYGRHDDSRRVTLALDTAASYTHISSDIIDELGYSPAEGEAITSEEDPDRGCCLDRSTPVRIPNHRSPHDWQVS